MRISASRVIARYGQRSYLGELLAGVAEPPCRTVSSSAPTPTANTPDHLNASMAGWFPHPKQDRMGEPLMPDVMGLTGNSFRGRGLGSMWRRFNRRCDIGEQGWCVHLPRQRRDRGIRRPKMCSA